jgi:hypothetical protein
MPFRQTLQRITAGGGFSAPSSFGARWEDQPPPLTPGDVTALALVEEESRTARWGTMDGSLRGLRPVLACLVILRAAALLLPAAAARAGMGTFGSRRRGLNVERERASATS